MFGSKPLVNLDPNRIKSTYVDGSKPIDKNHLNRAQAGSAAYILNLGEFWSGYLK